jgi:hypothetical protein
LSKVFGGGVFPAVAVGLTGAEIESFEAASADVVNVSFSVSRVAPK